MKEPATPPDKESLTRMATLGRKLFAVKKSELPKVKPTKRKRP